MSQIYSSQIQPPSDSAEWQAANQQRLLAIELQKKKVQELELRHQAQQLKPVPISPLELQREKYAVRDLEQQNRDRETLR
jgi:hypothetical protein